MKREIIWVEPLSTYLENRKAPTSAVTREFALAEDEVPVMLLSAGAELPENWPQKHRPRCLRSEWLQLLPDGSQLYGRALQGLV